MNPAAKIKDCDEAKKDLPNWRAEKIKIDERSETMNDKEVWTAVNCKKVN